MEPSEPKKAGWLRAEMPGVAAIVDEFREAFGQAEVTGWIAGMRKRGEFWAEDYTTGRKVGKKPESKAVVAAVYQSPNGLPSMLEVERKMNGDVIYKDERMTMNEFIARFAEKKGRG